MMVSEGNVPIEIRTHEQAQLEEFLPQIQERFRESGLDEQADTIEAFEFHLFETDEVAGSWATASAQQWADILQYLTYARDIDNNRAWWLQQKLGERLQERLDEIELGDDE
jgi:hypothetical protein